MKTAPALHHVLLATLALAAGAAQAQFSSPMRDVENPDRFTYQERGSVQIQQPYLNGFINFPTPAGKRYVIEYVSLTCSTPSAADAFPQVHLNVLRTLGPSSTTTHSAPVVEMRRGGAAPFSGYVWTGSAQVKLFGDPNPFEPTGGNGIYLNIFHTDTSGTASCSALISGHTITP